MQVLSSEKLLQVWEAGLDRRPLARAVEMLRVCGASQQDEDPAALALGARDLRLLALREQAFGSEIDGIANCPQCGDPMEMQFSVDDVRLPARKEPETLSVESEGYAVRFRLPTSQDLLAVEFAGNEQEDGHRLLQCCVSDASWQGQAIAVNDLPEAVQDAVAASMAASDPQAEIELSLQCPSCGRSWREIFDIEAFFWNELQAWAIRMLRDIHQLASGYGWSEREILALTPLRRSIYLNLIAE